MMTFDSAVSSRSDPLLPPSPVFSHEMQNGPIDGAAKQIADNIHRISRGRGLKDGRKEFPYQADAKANQRDAPQLLQFPSDRQQQKIGISKEKQQADQIVKIANEKQAKPAAGLEFQIMIVGAVQGHYDDHQHRIDGPLPDAGIQLFHHFPLKAKDAAAL